jgi:hypothetical protein
VRCVLCGGNHPQISRDILSTKIWRKASITSSEIIHSSCTNQTHLTNSSRNYVCWNNQVKFLCRHKCRERATHNSKSSANESHARL